MTKSKDAVGEHTKLYTVLSNAIEDKTGRQLEASAAVNLFCNMSQCGYANLPEKELTSAFKKIHGHIERSIDAGTKISDVECERLMYTAATIVNNAVNPVEVATDKDPAAEE